MVKALKIIVAIFLLVTCDRKEFNNPNDPINYPSPPVLIAPIDDTITSDNPPVLKWRAAGDTAIDEAAIFQIDTDSTPDFKDPTTEIGNSLWDDNDSCFVAWLEPSGPAKQYWRVRLQSSFGVWGAWSTAGSFSVKYPLIGSYDGLTQFSRIVVKGSYAYITTDEGLEILEVSNPAQPKKIGSYQKTGGYYYYRYLCINSNYCYVTFDGGSGSGVDIIDISNPASPKLLGSVECWSAHELWVEGSYIYLASAYQGLVIIDAHNPAMPQISGSADTTFDGQDVVVYDHYAIVAGASSYSLRVIDVADKANPKTIGRCVLDALIGCIGISGPTLYCLGTRSTVVDISNPSAPKPVGYFQSDYYPYDIAIGEKQIFVASSSKFLIYDTANLYNIILDGTFGNQGFSGVAVDGDYAYLVGGDGLWVAKVR
jgi:hypothetical protein